MAIIIKIEPDRKEFDKAIEESAKKAKQAFEKTGIGDAIQEEQKQVSDAFQQIEKDAKKAASSIQSSFNSDLAPLEELRDQFRGLGERLDALRDRAQRLDATRKPLDLIPPSANRAAQSIEGAALRSDRLLVALKGLDTPLARVFRQLDDINDVGQVFGLNITGAGIAVGAFAGAVALGAGALVKMGVDGSEAARKIEELSKETGKSVEESQRLKVGTHDLTNELNALGGVLDAQTIKKAAEATEGFAIMQKQMTAIEIQVASTFSDAFKDAGGIAQQTVRGLGGVVVGLSADVALLVSTASGALKLIQQLRTEAAKIPGFRTADDLTDIAQRRLTQSPLTSIREIIQAVQGPGVPTPETRAGRTLSDLESLLRTGRLPDGGSAASRGLPPAPTAPRAPRAGGSSALDRPPELTREAQEALDRIDVAFELMGKNLNQLAEIQARNTKDLEEARTKQLELEERNQTATKEYLALREQTIKLENRNLELLGAKLTQIEQGGIFNVKLPLGAPPPLGGPSLLVPGVSQEQAFAPLREFSEQQQIARANQRMLDEMLDQYERWRDNVTGILEQTFADGFRRGPGNFFTRVIESLKETIQRILFSQLAQKISGAITPSLMNIFGGGNAPGIGSLGSGGGLGGFFGTLFGGGGGFNLGNLFRTPSFNPNASSIGIPASLSGGSLPIDILNRGGLFGSQPSILGGTIGGAVGAGKFSLSGLLGGLAPVIPLLGAGLGSNLGGSSTTGRILGGVGGGLLGVGGVLLAGGAGLLGGTTLGLGATAIGLLTNPFTLLAGVGLLVGAALLGRASQRKKDEKAADEIWVNEMNQIRQLIAQVNSDRIDGQEALAIAAQLRQQTIAGLNQIKTKSVRESRLTNQLRDLDNGVVAELRRAVERQAARQRIGPQLIPEFATGGRVPGIDRGFDSVLAWVRPGEAVVNQQQIALLGGPSALRRARVPGFDQGGRVPMTTPSSHNDSSAPMTIILEGVTVDAESIFVKGARTSGGQRVAVQVQRNARLDRRG